MDLLEGAIKLEPNPFLIGQNTFPPRRLTSRFTFSDNKEINSFEKAYEIKKSKEYAVFLAESLAKKASTSYWYY